MRHPIALIVLVCATLLSSHPALAQFSQQGPKLVGTSAEGKAELGSSVCLSADGNTAIVGGPDDNSNAGAAWIWTRSGGAWTQQGAKLVGSGAVGNAFQGSSVSLSADGNTAIVGGYGDHNLDGAAWVWTRSGGVWTQQGAKLVGSGVAGNANQGFSVALSADGNTAIIGGVTDNGQDGAAWVWTRSGTVWTQQGAKLVGSGAVNPAYQGWSVSLSADGNTAIVGGPWDNGQAGAAWIWNRSGGVWTQQGNKLVGSGAVGTFVYQGWSVSISTDGNTAIVGGPQDNNDTGAAWVWTRSGGVWAQQGAKLVGSGAGGGVVTQGSSVSLSADGNTAIVGGAFDNYDFGLNTAVGAAWVWTRSGGAWTQQGTKLVGSGAIGNAEQGASVSLSGDGKTAIVGGNHDNSDAGAAWVFAAPASGLPIPTLLGSATTPGAIATDGAKLYIGSGNNLLSMPIAGGSATTLYASATPCCILGIAQTGGNLFWIDPNGDPDATAIFRGPASGGSKTKVYSGFATGQPIVDGSGLTTDGSRLYAVDEVSGNVVRMNLDGSAIATLGSRYTGGFSTEHLNRVTVSDGMLYIADEGCTCPGGTITPKIVKMPAAGGGFTTLFDAGAGFAVRPHDIAVAGSIIFFTDSINNTIWKMPTSGGTPTAFITGVPFSRVDGITALGDALYVTDSGAGRVYKISLSQAAAPAKRRAVAPPGNGPSESVTQRILAAVGGTITLPSGSSVTFPPGAFVTDHDAVVSIRPMTSFEIAEYADSVAIVGAGVRGDFAVVIDTGDAAPQKSLVINVQLPSAVLASGATPTMFGRSLWIGQIEQLDSFEPLDSATGGNVVTATVPLELFTNQRTDLPVFASILVVGSTSVASMAERVSDRGRLELVDLSCPTLKFSSPIEGISFSNLLVGDGFGDRLLKGKPEFHDGIDIRVGDGHFVHAAADGCIFAIGWSASYGQVVIVHHPGDTQFGGTQTLYGHLKENSIQIATSKGVAYSPRDIIGPLPQWVYPKQHPCEIPVNANDNGGIGQSDSTGGSHEPHLHFEIANHLIKVEKGAHGRIDPVGCVIPGASISITTGGSGTGSVGVAVTGLDAIILCGTECTKAYVLGTELTLTANYDTSSVVFGGWQGGTCGSDPVCTFTVVADESFKAIFNHLPAGPVLLVSNTPLQPFSMVVGQVPSAQTFVIANAGSIGFDYQISYPSWLIVNPSSRTLQPGAHDTISVLPRGDLTSDQSGTIVISAPTAVVSAISSPVSFPVKVTVTAMFVPPTVSFTASQATITQGQSSTLSWTTTNATSVSISGVAGTQPVNGSVVVSPAATTTYTLTATGPGGTSSAATTVTVSSAGGVTGIAFSGGVGGFGSFINGKITPAGLSGISITCGWVGNLGSKATRTTTTLSSNFTCSDADVASWSDASIIISATVTGTTLTTSRTYP
jgi:hypothetical protein